MYTESVIFIFMKVKNCLEIYFCWEPGHLMYLLGCVLEKKLKAIPIYIQKRMLQNSNMCEQANKLTQNSIYRKGEVDNTILNT